MNINFKEEQRFNQWWIWLPLIGIASYHLYGIIHQILLNIPFDNNNRTDSGLLTSFIILLGVMILFLSLKLKTEINEQELRINFYPLVKKTINWNNIKSAKVIEYGFVGWGIRLWTIYGIVYNVRGNKGLFIELNNGKKLLIGTQNEKEMEEVVRKISFIYKI